MLKKVEANQADIVVNGHNYLVTHIPAATSGMWFTIQDICEVWAAVAIDLDGTTVGWRNQPDEAWGTEIIRAIRQAWDLPEPTSVDKADIPD